MTTTEYETELSMVEQRLLRMKKSLLMKNTNTPNEVIIDKNLDPNKTNGNNR